MAEPSNLSDHLWLLDGIEDFREYSLELVKHNRRTLAVLTHHLDPMIYSAPDFVEAISAFSRSSRQAQIQILIKDTKPIIGFGHLLVRLAQRIPSKIQVRKMTLEPNNKDMAFMLGDTDKLLYKNDDSVYRGFFNSTAAREVKPLREEFNYLWQYAEPEPEFQLLHI